MFIYTKYRLVTTGPRGLLNSNQATGVIDDRFDYTAGPARAPSILPFGARPEGTHDVFGQPFQGDLDGLMNLGYMSKPYETVTGLYNYGFRDYRPQQARFTTPDPIRDGNNWFAYVNNDPVNYVDWWGLESVYTYQLQQTGFSTSRSVDARGNVRTTTTQHMYVTNFYSNDVELLNEYRDAQINGNVSISTVERISNLSTPAPVFSPVMEIPETSVPEWVSNSLRNDSIVVERSIDNRITDITIITKEEQGNWVRCNTN